MLPIARPDSAGPGIKFRQTCGAARVARQGLGAVAPEPQGHSASAAAHRLLNTHPRLTSSGRSGVIALTPAIVAARMVPSVAMLLGWWLSEDSQESIWLARALRGRLTGRPCL